MYKSTDQPVIVIPNLNGGDELLGAVESLLAQSLKPYIIIVDNASTDGSTEAVLAKYPDIEVIRNSRNEGFAGGVNPGLRRAIELGAKYAGPFNDDAVANKQWLRQLVDFLDAHPRYGAAAPKVVTSDRERLDSTGDYYTDWGLPYPRGRREYNLHKFDDQTDIFAATGAASLYRVKTLREIGLFDEDFFAYYEDVDLSFRLQLAGWKVAFVPGAVVDHHIGMTSARVKGFTTHQTMKNLPLLWYKNVPGRYLFRIGCRLWLAQTLFFGRAVTRGQGWAAFSGACAALYLLVKKIPTRRRIQRSKKVSDEYIWDMLVHDLPPNASALRHLRSVWWKVSRKKLA
ncbi:MAG TPA: glycosyltransferase family 2 protein [Candidatus Saccharimonadales bacterium]|nr:glycosyltransferase family 2 protein [Candidatus Saccharimonadales bacterium]